MNPSVAALFFPPVVQCARIPALFLKKVFAALLIAFFGTWREICTARVFIDKEVAFGAKLVNWKYGNDLKKSPSSIDEVKNAWKTAAWFDKESSLASYRGERNVLALLGFRVAEARDSTATDASSEYKACVSKENVLLRLAEVARLRWMAFMRTHGVVRWDVPSAGGGTELDKMVQIMKAAGEKSPKVKANVRMWTGQHAALVEFEQLPKLSCVIEGHRTGKTLDGRMFVGRGKGEGRETNANMQWNDMKFIEWLPNLIDEMRLGGGVGRKIVKSVPVIEKGRRVI